MSTSAASSPLHYFGIRHHGPGCARSLLRAFESLQPDCILVEGPPEAEPLLSFLAHADLQPPVAVLIHASEDTGLAAFYPFATFSPEWQALQRLEGAQQAARTAGAVVADAEVVQRRRRRARAHAPARVRVVRGRRGTGPSSRPAP